jgi:hypothetical protein
MNWPTVGLFAVLSLAALSVDPRCAQDQAKPKSAPQDETPWADDMSGFYHCAGHGYEGVVTVRKAGQAYVVAWLAGNAHSVGVGMREGDLLVVGWAMEGESAKEKDDGYATRGVTVYKLHPKTKRLVGRYLVLPGSGEPMPETLEYFRPLARNAKKKTDI